MSRKTNHTAGHGYALRQLLGYHRTQPEETGWGGRGNVNYATEKATVIFDPSVLSEDAIIGKIQDVGYGVATAKIELPITGMTCANCVGHR